MNVDVEEELSVLKFDLGHAYKRGDKFGVSKLQERIDGLLKQV